MASTRVRNGRIIGLYRDAQGRQNSAGTFGTEREVRAVDDVMVELDDRGPAIVGQLRRVPPPLSVVVLEL